MCDKIQNRILSDKSLHRFAVYHIKRREPDMKRMWIALFLALVFVFTLTVSAEKNETLSYAVTGLPIDSEEHFSPEDVRIVELKPGMFSCGGDVLRRRIVDFENTSALNITLPTDARGADNSYDIHGYTEASFIITDVENDYSALAFGISISGIYGNEYELEIALISESDDVVSSCKLVPSEWNLVYFDITGARGSEYILTVRTLYDSIIMPDTISISSPYLIINTPSGFAYSDKYLTTEYEAFVGSVSMESGNVTPDERGDAILFANILTKNSIKAGTNAVCEIRLSGVEDGFLSFGARTEEMGKNEFNYSASIPINANDGIYAIPIRLDGTLESYSLDFANVECTGFFKIESVKIFDGGRVPTLGNSGIGSVDHIRMNLGGVTFSGSMERWAVSEYSDSGIRYFAIPALTSENLDTAIEIGRSSTTTIFEYTMDVGSHHVPSDLYMFFAAVIGADGEIIPLSSPRFAEANTVTERELSNMGLYNASAAGAFESNVSHIILDIDLSALIASAESRDAATISYYTTDGVAANFTIDRNALKSRDRDIEFYTSAGINVYLRLICSTPIDEFTYGGNDCLGYYVMTDDANSLAMYASIVRFISARYSGISGISLGLGVNSTYNVGDVNIFDVTPYADNVALLARVTYNAASAENSDIMILIEFDEYRDYDNQVSDRVLGTAIARRLSDIGAIPWSFVYSIDSAEDALSSPATLSSALSALEIEGACSVMYFYDPMSDNLTYKYSSFVASLDRNEFPVLPTFTEYLAMTFGGLCEKGDEYGAETVFMSLGDILQNTDHEFYSSLKNTGMGNSDRHIVDLPTSEADDALNSAAGKYVISDFSDKYYCLDWISGGGVAAFTTEHSPIFSERDGIYSRVLRSSVDTVGAAGAAGLIIKNLQGVTDLIDTKIVFDFSVFAEVAGEDLTVVFVVGADDNRAEFTAREITYGEAHTLVCDLGEYEYASSVEYIGVMIYSEESVDFDLSRVSVYSDTRTDEELFDLFNPAPDTVDGAYDVYVLVALILIVAVISVVGCIVFVRRDKEESEAHSFDAKVDRSGK